MKKIETSILIQATPQIVWNHLMDFAAYPQWNSFIHISGEASVGQQLHNTIYLKNGSPQVFTPEVLVVSPQREFRWKGKLWVKGLFDGEHYFQLEKIAPTTTQLIHGELFSGLLVHPILRLIEKQTIQGFETMNTALKQRSES